MITPPQINTMQHSDHIIYSQLLSKFHTKQITMQFQQQKKYEQFIWSH